MKTYHTILISLCFISLISCKKEKIQPQALTACFEIEHINCEGYTPAAVSINNCSQGAASYLWEWGDGNLSTGANPPAHSYPSGGIYTITLTVTDQEGRQDTASTAIIVREQIKFEKTFEESRANGLVQTQDGGFAMLSTAEVNGKIQFELVLSRVDKSGMLLWEKTFLKVEAWQGKNLIETADGGFAFLGEKDDDIVVTRTDAEGNEIWQYSYGGAADEMGSNLIQTADGGFAILGATQSMGSGHYDFFLLKIDQNGSILWQKTYGGTQSDSGSALCQTDDGGFLLTGTTHSKGAGMSDVYLIRTDRQGDMIWDKTFGGIGHDTGSDVLQTSDGGIAILGSTTRNGGQVFYLLKTNYNGILIWENTYTQLSKSSGNDLIETSDGGFAFVGSSNHAIDQTYQMHLIHTSSHGQELWNKSYGGTAKSSGQALIKTSSCGFALLGGKLATIHNELYFVRTDWKGESQ